MADRESTFGRGSSRRLFPARETGVMEGALAFILLEHAIARKKDQH